MEEKLIGGKRLYLVTNDEKAREIAEKIFSGDRKIPTDALSIVYHIKYEVYLTHIHVIEHNDSFKKALLSLKQELVTGRYKGHQNDETFRQVLNDWKFSSRNTLLDFVKDQLSKI